MPLRRLSFANALRADRRGVTAMEYAIVASVVLTAVTLAMPALTTLITSRVAAFIALI